MKSILCRLAQIASLAAGLAACGETVEPPADVTAPLSSASIRFPAGQMVPAGAEVLTSTLEVTALIDANEPSWIYFSTDGVAPTPGARNTAQGRAPASVRLNAPEVGQRTYELQWFAVDLAGNIEAAPHHVLVTFDRQAPTATVEPPGGTFTGPIDVTLSTDEPATVFWSVDGRSPIPNTSNTSEAESPVQIRLSRNTRLWLLVRDEAGNQAQLGPYDYTIDSQAPSTTAYPPSGHHLGPITVDLRTDDEAAQVLFTTDGTEPGEDAERWADAQTFAETLTLRFRALDPGGNLEPTQTEIYTIGARAVVAPAPVTDLTRFDVPGGLRLAAALLDASGALSGSPQAVDFGQSWSAWATAVAAIDAYTLRGGTAPHVLHSPGVAARAEAEQVVDADGDGSNLDDTWAGRVAAFNNHTGGQLPEGLHPISLFYVGASASLLRAQPEETTADGRPLADDDVTYRRWSGVSIRDHAIGADALGAGLRALATRARAASAFQHEVGQGVYVDEVVPIIGLRCNGCHGADAAPPQLDRAAALLTANLLTPGVSPATIEGNRLLAMLSGAEPHLNAPATPAQVEVVARWIETGAAAQTTGDALGATGREGAYALLAVEQAALALRHAEQVAIYDSEGARLTALGSAGPTAWVVERALSDEMAGGPGLPRRLEALVVEDATFQTDSQARLLRGLVEVLRLATERPNLFEHSPIAGDGFLPSAPALAQPLLRRTTENLRTLTMEGGWMRASWRTDGGASASVALVAIADAAVALHLAQRYGPADLELGELPSELAASLVSVGVDLNGGYPTFLGSRTAPRLGTQLAVLEALLLAGDAQAHSAAAALWRTLDTLWWDEAAGAWQTTFGDPAYVYTPALAARAVDALRLAMDAELPDAELRLRAFFDAVVRGELLASETWLDGEVGAGPDADGDGRPRPGAAQPAPGRPPVFNRAAHL